MSDAGTGGTPAGWYEDGVTAGQERYWDGTQWTDQFRPLAPPALVTPPAPAAPAAEAPAAAGAPAAAPASDAYPGYQPAPVPRAGGGLSKGAIIGIIAGVVAVIVAIVLILGFTVWGWAGGGGGSSAQQATYLSKVKSSAAVTASDQQLLEAGQAMCDAGRQIVGGDYLGGMSNYLELLGSDLDVVTLSVVANYAMSDLCPDVQAQLEQMGEDFLF